MIMTDDYELEITCFSCDNSFGFAAFNKPDGEEFIIDCPKCSAKTVVIV